MKIYISAKQIRKRGNQIAPQAYELSKSPETLRQLITVLVSDSVENYNRRLLAKESTPVLAKGDIDSMSQIGKIGFGIPFGRTEADLQEALDTAFQGFEDGLYRLFIGDREVEYLDAPLHLQEGDTVTVIRLVMLTGGYF